MKKRISRFMLVLAMLTSAVMSAHAGDLEPPPGPVSPTRPPDTCYDNTGSRFVDCGDGTIKDTVTGLYWLKQASCLPRVSWAEANNSAALLAHGQCGLTDGSLPGDWRLPTLECPSGDSCTLDLASGELGELVNLGTANGCGSPALPDMTGNGCYTHGDPFLAVETNYWSATTEPSNPIAAWVLMLMSDQANCNNSKATPGFVWPVRGGY